LLEAAHLSWRTQRQNNNHRFIRFREQLQPRTNV